ncbi:MAG: cold shock domain-containing protein [Chloroflexales bacterium]|nr:cold shock domain-containing protein [Chloroflexales bacterium]
MAEALSDEAAAPAADETGIVRWFDTTRRMGVIARADGSTLFVPPYGLAEGQGALATGQPVTFTLRENAKGPYAAEVRVTNAPPPGAEALTALALEIAQALSEAAPPALAQIRKIIRALGQETTQEAVREALRVEEAGGMLLPDESRRRTPGGVFFVLIRERLTAEQRVQIFPTPYQRRKKPATPGGAATGPPPAPPPFTWDDRLALIAAASEQRGKVRSVKMTLIGRPGHIEEQAQFTLLTMTHSGPRPALPKGVPAPDPLPETTYSVYIGKKQWKAVAEALQDPEDALIVEGTPMLDTASGTIAIFATKTTTKLLQQASRPPRPPEA